VDAHVLARRIDDDDSGRAGGQPACGLVFVAGCHLDGDIWRSVEEIRSADYSIGTHECDNGSEHCVWMPLDLKTRAEVSLSEFMSPGMLEQTGADNGRNQPVFNAR